MISAAAMIDTDFIGHCEYCRRPTASRDSDGDWACANGTGCATPLVLSREQRLQREARSRKTQKPRNNRVEFAGKIRTIPVWAAYYGISRRAFDSHMSWNNWTVEQELAYRQSLKDRGLPTRGQFGRKHTTVSVDGVERTVHEWAGIVGSTADSIRVSAKKYGHGIADEVKRRLNRLAEKAKKGGAR